MMLLVSMPLMFSQGRDCSWKDRIKSERIAFITQEINLTSAEAEKFWPVYNSYKDTKDQAQQAIRDAFRNLAEAEKSGTDIEKCLDAYVKALDAKAGIETNALKAYKKVLPADKIAKLYLAEEKFRVQQIHRLHQGPGDKPGEGGRRPGNPR